MSQAPTGGPLPTEWDRDKPQRWFDTCAGRERFTYGCMFITGLVVILIWTCVLWWRCGVGSTWSSNPNPPQLLRRNPFHP